MKVLLSFVVIAIVAFCLWAFAQPMLTQPATATLEGAIAVCQPFVEDRLRAPKTASFVPGAVAEWVGPGSMQITVAGAVDAQNAFGALIRNTYVCVVEHQQGAQWKLIDLKLAAR